MRYMLVLCLFACSPDHAVVNQGQVEIVEVEAEELVVGSVEVEEVVVEDTPSPCKEEEVCHEFQAALSSWELEVRDIFDICYGVCRLSRDLGIPTSEIVEEVAALAISIVAMQPAFARGWEGGYKRALEIAWDIQEAVYRHGDASCQQLETGDFENDSDQVPTVSPFALASMARRESGFLRVTEKGYRFRNGRKERTCRWCRGAAGEMGMFQFMPKGFLLRTFMPKTCSPFDRRCSIQGVVRALQHIRCMCIDQFGERCTMSTYVAGYGLTRLPSPERADNVRGVPEARGYLCEVREDCAAIWPLYSHQKITKS